MIPGMIPDRMPSKGDSTYQVGMVLGYLANHEKCSFGAMSFQYVKQRRCESRVRTVIECERRDWLLGINVSYCSEKIAYAHVKQIPGDFCDSLKGHSLFLF